MGQLDIHPGPPLFRSKRGEETTREAMAASGEATGETAAAGREAIGETAAEGKLAMRFASGGEAIERM